MVYGSTAGGQVQNLGAHLLNQIVKMTSSQSAQQLLFSQPKAHEMTSLFSRPTQHLQNKTWNVKDNPYVLYNSPATVCDVRNCI